MVDTSSVKYADKRGRGRQRVLKGGKMLFNGSVMDCLVRNLSPHGARISLAVPSALPDRVVLQLPGGATYPARRCWTAGHDSGFQFTGAPALHASAAPRAVPVLEALQAASPAKALALLDAERGFDDPTLQGLAADLRHAHAALAGALQGLVDAGHTA